MNKIVLITGATSGFGKSSAFKFAENKYDLIITGRRKELLTKVAGDIKENFNVKVLTLNFDVRNLKEVENAIKSLPAEWQKIDVLVNNAGLSAGLSPFDECDIDDWERMIDTNVKGLLYVTKCVAPLMIKNSSGHIINISSIAGKETYLNGNVYCASKSAVDTLSKAMRVDLLKHNIKVTNISPGAAETEFSIVRFHGDKEKAGNVYKGYTPLTPDDVADTVFYAASRPANVNIAEITITPLAQGSAFYYNKKV
ncbi:MAG: SDR family oxidoreductase [Bacteroidales bacterium]|nr:SDR family oxidoreductase [Bacteroidales bacterium]